MTDLPAPTATRLTRARWLDARLLIGLLLVLLSVVIGAKVVADADQRVAGLVGDPRPRRGHAAVRRRPAGGVGEPRRRHRALPRGRPRTSTGWCSPARSGAASCCPVAAVGRADPTARRRIVIEVDRFGVAGLDKGRVVDVYAVPRHPERRAAGPPELVLDGRHGRRGREVRRQRVRRQRVEGRRQRCSSTARTCPT